jgi:hypothetical protein
MSTYVSFNTDPVVDKQKTIKGKGDDYSVIDDIDDFKD